MTSISQFKAHLLSFVRLMIASHMQYVDVSYKGRVYRFYMEDVGEAPKQIRQPRRQQLTAEIKSQRCPECKKLMLNGVCMSSLCPARQRRAVSVL